MDAIKIIKKHGQPSGVPVITAYVAEDAPGEAQNTKKYLQTITFIGGFTISIITDKSTALTTPEIAQILRDNGFNSSSAICGGTWSADISMQSAGTLTIPVYKGIYGSTGNPLTVNGVYEFRTLTITDGALVLSSSSRSNLPLTIDKVLIQEI